MNQMDLKGILLEYMVCCYDVTWSMSLEFRIYFVKKLHFGLNSPKIFLPVLVSPAAISSSWLPFHKTNEELGSISYA